MQLKIAIAIAGTVLAQGSYGQSLHEAVQQTINENPEIQAAKDERLAVEEQISQAKAGYFPTVDIAAGYGFEQANNPTTRARLLGGQHGTTQYSREETSIQLRQMLFDGLATPNEVNRHEARTDARAYTVFGQSEITALKAVEAYLNILRREALLKLAEENLAVHSKTNDQIVLRSQQGVGKKADIEQSTGRVSLAEANVRSEQGNLNDAKTAFLRIVGVLPAKLELPTHPESKLPASIDAAIEKAVANHPILKSANADVDSAFSQHETAKAAYMPRVDFEAAASHNDDINGIPGKNEDLTAMLRLKYNLFNGGKDMARRQETAHLIAQSKDIRDNTYRQVVETTRLSWVAHTTIKSQLEFFKSHKEASAKALEAYQMQFNIGQRTLLDLLDSANEMFVANSAYVNAQFDELYAAHRILASMGGLNEYLAVNLPAEATPLKK
ncbi:MAG: TolC family outer membrane protein [Methylococcales bacterium]